MDTKIAMHYVASRLALDMSPVALPILPFPNNTTVTIPAQSHYIGQDCISLVMMRKFFDMR
jgi:hypothetical protein